MRFSKKSQYGLRAMSDLVFHYEEGPLSAKDVSKNQGIPLQYLEQIFNCLKKKGLVKTTRGPKGGYILSKEPSKIKVGDIIKALENNYSLTECLGLESKRSCARVDICLTKKFWEKLNKSIKGVLNSTTLKDICPKGPDKAKSRKVEHNYLFQI